MDAPQTDDLARPPYVPDWLAEIVTPEAKRDPNWRAKARTGDTVVTPVTAPASS